MLVDFRIKNFKQFKNNTFFSLVPDADVDELAYSILKEKVENLDLEGLSTAIVYGPNGVGKTNLINAISFLKKVVLNRSIIVKNSNISEHASKIPNLELNEKNNVEFEISFVNENLFFNYELYLDLGVFGELSNKRKIVFEKLNINDTTVYERENNELKDLNPDFLVDSFKYDKNLLKIINKKLKSENLFLNDCSILFKNDIIEKFIDWFENKLIILNKNADFNNLITDQSDIISQSYYSFPPINNILNSIDTKSEEILFSIEDDNSIQPKSLINLSSFNKNILVNSDEFESEGTIKLINLIPIIIHVIKNGITLMVDELDTSIHSTIVMGLISIFHDDRINTKNGQLIITTHNPIYMTPQLLRRDEIVFLNNNQDEVELYALSDFKAVKKGENYTQSYLQNQYRALNDINLNQIIIGILNNEKKETKK